MRLVQLYYFFVKGRLKFFVKGRLKDFLLQKMAVSL